MFKWCWMNTGDIRTPKVYTHHARFLLCYSHTILNVQVGKNFKKILSKVKVKLNTSSGVLLTTVGCRRNYPLTALLLTFSSPEVAGMGVRKNDAPVSLCQCPSFLIPSFCWTQPILFILCYLWLINMERRSNHRPFRREYLYPLSGYGIVHRSWLGEGLGA